MGTDETRLDMAFAREWAWPAGERDRLLRECESLYWQFRRFRQHIPAFDPLGEVQP